MAKMKGGKRGQDNPMAARYRAGSRRQAKKLRKQFRSRGHKVAR